MESNVRLFFFFVCFSFILETGTLTRSLCIYANRLANTVSHCLFLKMMQLARHPFIFYFADVHVFLKKFLLPFHRAGILEGANERAMRKRKPREDSGGKKTTKEEGKRRGEARGGVCSTATKVL